MKKMGMWIGLLAALIIFITANIFYNKIDELTGSDAMSNKKTMIEMSGEFGDYNAEESIDDPAHDPSIFKADDTYYVVSTGIARETDNPGGIYIRKSEESIGGPWEAIGEIPVPEWAKKYQVGHLWAPHVVEKDGVFYMYYAVSVFGTNNSAIGVSKTETPGDLNSWEDLGTVVTSGPGVSYNAIDPMVFEADGTWWMVFGSHFGGIVLQELDNMTELTGEVYTIASRQSTTAHNAIEGPTIFERDGYFYLITSWDQCCNGVDSTYKVAVGRAESVTGPYVDPDGEELLNGGGEVILETYENQIGPGGQDILEEDGTYYMVYHYYDGDADGVIRMQIREINFNNDWPSFK